MGGELAPQRFKQIQVHFVLFRDTMLTPWKINNSVKGFYKRVGNLELRTINDAGHLLPMDQGEVALHMVKDFINNALGESK
jgi:carboxypeptidase C (cathepsin A)